jgi:hypothetical protein
MAGGDSVDASKLTGLGKYFNGNTMAGRANVSDLVDYRNPGPENCWGNF